MLINLPEKGRSPFCPFLSSQFQVCRLIACFSFFYFFLLLFFYFTFCSSPSFPCFFFREYPCTFWNLWADGKWRRLVLLFIFYPFKWTRGLGSTCLLSVQIWEQFQSLTPKKINTYISVCIYIIVINYAYSKKKKKKDKQTNYVNCTIVIFF